MALFRFVRLCHREQEPKNIFSEQQMKQEQLDFTGIEDFFSNQGKRTAFSKCQLRIESLKQAFEIPDSVTVGTCCIEAKTLEGNDSV